MPSESAQALCLAHLREEILSGRLAPGERIRPEVVAARLGFSRMLVQAALNQLNAEGLVTLRTHRGATVTRQDAAELAEIFEMRALLEGLCARHAARSVTPAAIADLDGDCRAMRCAMADPARWVEGHERFHDRFCALAGRPRAAAEARRLRLMLRPLLQDFVAVERDPEALGHEHEVIVDALRDRDGRRAERLVIARVNANAVALLGQAAPGRMPGRHATR